MRAPLPVTWAQGRRLAGLALLGLILFWALYSAPPSPGRGPRQATAEARWHLHSPLARTDSAADSAAASDFELSRGIPLNLGLPIEKPPPPPPMKPIPPSAAEPPPPSAPEDSTPEPPETAPIEFTLLPTPPGAGSAPTDSTSSTAATSDEPTEMALRPRVIVQPRPLDKIVLKRKIDASILLQARVGVDGGVLDVRVIRGIPNCVECEQSAVTAVRQYSFDPPPVRAGSPEVWTTPIEIRFSYLREELQRTGARSR